VRIKTDRKSKSRDLSGEQPRQSACLGVGEAPRTVTASLTQQSTQGQSDKVFGEHLYQVKSALLTGYRVYGNVGSSVDDDNNDDDDEMLR
jgi:hypothetical protein